MCYYSGMEILSNQMLNSVYSYFFSDVSEKPTIYYLSDDIVDDSFELYEGKVSEQLSEDTSSIRSVNLKRMLTGQAEDFKSLKPSLKIVQDHFLDSRPFDKLILITSKYIFMISGISYHAFKLDNGQMTQILKSTWITFITIGTAYAAFTLPKAAVVLSEGMGKKVTKKGKLKRAPQRYLLLVSDKERKKGSYKRQNGSYTEPIYASKVSGHWRYYQNTETMGHNRYGDLITGRTWVNPYTKGEGKELMEKIRIFLKG